MSDELVEAVARGLTKAQRRALKHGYVDRQRGYWPLYNAMRSKGLIENGGELSNLGRVIRQHIKEADA